MIKARLKIRRAFWYGFAYF